MAKTQTVAERMAGGVADWEPTRLAIGAVDRDDRVTLDRRDGADIVQDITETPWRIADGVVQDVVAHHVFEHVEHDTLAETVWPELARICDEGAWLTVTVPVGLNADADCRHRSTWTYRTPACYAEATPVGVDWPSEWHPGREETPGWRLVRRELSMHGHGPAGRLTPVVDWLADRWPVFAQDLPGCSGELRAVFKREPRGGRE